MASQIMDTIAETERRCDELVQAAREKAAAIAEDAQKRADALTAEAAAKARDREKTAVAEAERRAQRLIEAGRAESARRAETLRDECRDKLDAAVRQTALYVLSLSEGGA